MTYSQGQSQNFVPKTLHHPEQPGKLRMHAAYMRTVWVASTIKFDG